MLCIQGTLVPSELVFTTAGDIVTSQSSVLHPDHVDVLIFLKKKYIVINLCKFAINRYQNQYNRLFVFVKSITIRIV